MMQDNFNILPCCATLALEYVNKRRIHSKRIVDVHSFVSNSPDGMLVGYCHRRKMARSFSYHGIVSAVDTQSGEVIAPERLFLYLLSIYKSTPNLPPLTEAQLRAYQPPQTRRLAELKQASKNNNNTAPAVCLTGFSAAEKATLTDAAKAAGFKVYRDYSPNLTYLVCGSTPGGAKLAKAEAIGIEIIDKSDFLDLLNKFKAQL